MMTSQISQFTIHGKSQKKFCKNNKFKISAPSQNEKFELPDGSYSVSDIQDYFKYIIKKLETVTDNLPIRIHVCKIENRIISKSATGYYLEPLTPETPVLLGSTNNQEMKDKNGENIPHLEITEILLVPCNIVNNDYQHDL